MLRSCCCSCSVPAGCTHASDSHTQIHTHTTEADPNFTTTIPISGTEPARLGSATCASIQFHFISLYVRLNRIECREKERERVWLRKGMAKSEQLFFLFLFSKKTKINRNISERKKREILYSILLCLSERMWKCRRRRKREWISAW